MPFKSTLPPAILQKAKEELNEDEETRDQRIQELREKVLAHKALKCRTDDAFLIRFLRARKFDVDRAYEQLINYFTIRAQYPEHFKGLTIAAVKTVMKDKPSIALPQRDSEGHKILMIRPGAWNVEKYSIFELLKLNVINMEKLIEDEVTQICGIMVIVNAADMGMNHVRNLDRNYAKIMSSVMQDAFPCRVKGIHFTNEPTFFGMAFSIIRPFLKEKMSSRLNFHGSNLESLHKVLAPEVLPKELGGMLGPLDKLGERWFKELKKSADLDKIFEYSIELPRAITTQKSDELEASVTGTFKKLNLD